MDERTPNQRGSARETVRPDRNRVNDSLTLRLWKVLPGWRCVVPQPRSAGVRPTGGEPGQRKGAGFGLDPISWDRQPRRFSSSAIISTAIRIVMSLATSAFFSSSNLVSKKAGRLCSVKLIRPSRSVTS